MIRLIASDIDGTLVPEGSHKISHEYFKVIKDLKEVGISHAAADSIPACSTSSALSRTTSILSRATAL